VINNKTNRAENCLKVGTWGAVVAAICCFTPALVVGLGIVGLGMLTPYLDYLLLPALGLFLILAAFGLWQRSVRSK
jgi:mercuric ion transport protein